MGNSWLLPDCIIDVGWRENGIFSDLKDVPSQKLAVRGILGVRTEGSVESRNVGAMESRATFILETKGLRSRRPKRAVNGGKFHKWRRYDGHVLQLVV